MITSNVTIKIRTHIGKCYTFYNLLSERGRTQPFKNVYDLLESDHLVALYCKEAEFSYICDELNICDELKGNGYYDIIENCTNIFPENFIAEIVMHIARHNELTKKGISVTLKMGRVKY